MAEIIELQPGAAHPGLYPLADLPQRGSVSKQAFGAGWHELDQIFKFYLGQFIVVTGIAGHGKSTFMLNVLLKLALDRGVRSFLYVPENESHLRKAPQDLDRRREAIRTLLPRPNARAVRGSADDERATARSAWVLDRAYGPANRTASRS
jgi:predicted ATP-dependent serine protease